jgi:hypothetical protein
MCEDIKGVTRSQKSKKDRPSEKGQTTIYKTPHRKLKIEHHEPHNAFVYHNHYVIPDIKSFIVISQETWLKIVCILTSLIGSDINF